MKKKILMFIAMIVVTVTFISCTDGCFSTNKQSTTNNIVNNVTNEITNKVVSYEEFTVEDLQNAVQTANKRVENASVGVTLKAISSGAGYVSEDSLGIGTGVIYKREEVKENGILRNYKYYVITNRHVITSENQDNTKVYIYLKNEDIEIEANILGFDNKVDLACLTFNHSTYIQPIEFGDSDKLEKGTFVFAVGNPGGYEYYGSLTFGVVSAPLRYLADDTDGDGTNDFYASYVQHDASINPGNSGGGLFTIDGKLIGINTLKIVQAEVDNMGFSIPSNLVKTIIENYLELGKEILRPSLGITGLEVRNLTPYLINQYGLKDIPAIYLPNERAYGLYVSSVVSGGSISGSGIKKDDIILTIDGTKIKESSQVSALLNDLSTYQIGNQVTITYYSRSTNSVETVDIILKK